MWVLHGGDYEVNTERIQSGSFVGTYAVEGFGKFGMTFEQIFNSAHKCAMGLGHSPQVKGPAALFI